MTRLKPILAFAFLLLASALPAAHADLIKQNSTYTRTVLMTSASDHISPYTGAASTLTEQVSQAGGAMATATLTATALGNGRFAIVLTSAQTNTLGALDLTVTASGADPSDTHDQVLVDLPGGAVASVIAPVSLASTQSFNNTGQTTTPSWLGVSSVFLSAEQAKLTAASTAQQAGQAVTLGTTDAANLVASVSLSGALLTVSSTGTTSGVSEVLTQKQAQALALAVASGNDVTSGPPVASGSATVTYYLVGAAQIAGNIVEVATVNYDANKNQTSRTVKIAQPFPAVN